MDGLCNNLLQLIMQQLNQKTLCTCMLVSKRWLFCARSQPVCAGILARIIRIFPSLTVYTNHDRAWDSLCAIGNIDLWSGENYSDFIWEMCMVQVPIEISAHVRTVVNYYGKTHLVNVMYNRMRVVRMFISENSNNRIIQPFYNLLLYGILDECRLFEFTEPS